MQQLVDEAQAVLNTTDLAKLVKERLGKSLIRLENSLNDYMLRKEGLKENLLNELDGYISQLGNIIGQEEVKDADGGI